MTTSIAPAMATSKDLAIWAIEDASPIQLVFEPSITGSNVPRGFIERYIHSEIYKAFPEVKSIVHAHTTEVLPFAAAGIPLRAQLHTSGFLGARIGTPIFNYQTLASTYLPQESKHDYLIRTPALGVALANTFRPDCHVVLMKLHGMVVRGTSIRDAVFRAYYTKQNAIVQYQTAVLDMPTQKGPHRHGLTEEEAVDAMETNESAAILGRSWLLWAALVDRIDLYKNDLRDNGPVPIPGA